MTAYWVDTGTDRRLAIVARPRGESWLGYEISLMKRAGIDVLVSMLEPEEARELGLSAERAECEAHGIEFRSHPIPDRGTPSSFSTFVPHVRSLQAELRQGRSIAVHCRFSIGRSSLLLASLLIAEGHTPDQALAMLTKARGLEVPDTSDQVAWLKNFADLWRSASHASGLERSR